MAGLRLNGFVRILMKNLYVGMFEIIILYLPEDEKRLPVRSLDFIFLIRIIKLIITIIDCE